MKTVRVMWCDSVCFLLLLASCKGSLGSLLVSPYLLIALVQSPRFRW